MKKLLIFLFIIFAISCKTIRIVDKEYITKTDTIKTTRIEKIFEAVHDTTTIENPCDSLGLLNSFYAKIKIPKGSVVVKSSKGKIVATVNVDSIADVYENKYRSKISDNVKVSEKVVEKKVIPAWAIITIFIESVIILGYIYIKVFKPF